MMTKREALRQTAQENTLLGLGFTLAEAEALRRISMTLHRWYELECGTDNGCIERDETTNKAYWLNSHTMRRTPIADREAGAIKRLKAIIDARNDRRDAFHHPADRLSYYLQTDPRGAVLYILRPGDVPEGADVSGYYNRGICVY
jgi:hypothetical protein